MRYPRIDPATCSNTVIEFLQQDPHFSSGDTYNAPKDLSDDLKVSVDEAIERLWELFSFFEDQNKRIDGDFDSQACSTLHSDLSIGAQAAADTSFWRWLAFYNNGALASIVKARFGDGTTPKHFGVEGGLDDCYLKMLWFRANSVFVAEGSIEQQYELAHFGGADLWRSHILRPEYGRNTPLVRALVRFVRDRKLPIGDRNNPGAKLGVRDLAPEIRNQAFNYALELMSEDDAYQFLDSLLASSVNWCGKSAD